MATIFSHALANNGFAIGVGTFRTACPLTGGALDQVRVTFQADSGGCTVVTAGIGKSFDPALNQNDTADTTATPIQLLWSGNPGFTIGANATIVSDWVNFTGFTSSDFLVCIFDFTSGAARYDTAGVACVKYKSGAASYNQTSGQAVDGFVDSANTQINVLAIETQSTGGGGGGDILAPNLQTAVRMQIIPIGY